MKKKFLALLLAALMVVSLLPTVAFAGEVTDCTYTQKVTTPEDGKTYGLKLNGKDKGKFTFEANGKNWNIKEAKEGGKYLNAENGKLVLGDTAATAWTYRNGAFSVSEKTTQKFGGHWFLFWYVPGRGTKTVTTTYYLNTVTDGQKLSTCYTCAELFEEVSGSHEYGKAFYVDATNHKYICKHCCDAKTEPHSYNEETGYCVCGAFNPTKVNVMISVDVKEKTSKQYVGWGWYGSWKDVTTYTAAIKTEATGVKVCKVEYQLNGGRWTNGTSVSSNKPIEKLNVRVWDSNGNKYAYEWPEEETPATYTVTFANVTGGAVYDAATSGEKVTEITVDSGSAVAVDGNKITIGGTDYYAIADSGYEFKEFSATVPETITAATTITPVFEETVTPKFSTIADILPADFPSGDATEEDTEVIAPTGAWKTSSGAYAAAIINYPSTGDPTELDFINVGDVYDRIGLQPDTPLIKVNDSTYKVTAPKFELTFTLEAGELKKINFTAIEERWEEYNGDYTAPAPKFTVTFASAEHGAIYDAATSGEKVTEITVDSGSTVAVDGNKITIGGTDYYAIADSGYEFKEFSATVPETITAATTITPVFEAAPTFNTVADILATVTNFPSGEWFAPDNAWKNLKDLELYKDTEMEVLLANDSASVELTQSVTSSGTNWTCSSSGTTFTFNMTSGVLESVTVSGSRNADGTYYAERETLQNIISTCINFPTTANTGWKCNGQSNGSSIYISKPYGNALYIKYYFGDLYRTVGISQLSSYAGKINGGYEYEGGGGFLLHFNIQDNKLVSIEIVNPELVAGTYTPADPADIQTIEDIVLWAAEYPLDTYDWNGSENNNTMYLSAGVLNLESEGKWWVVNPDEKVTTSNGNYVWSDKDTDGTITFNMTNGVLTSITVAGFDDNRANSNDTYTAPAT